MFYFRTLAKWNLSTSKMSFLLNFCVSLSISCKIDPKFFFMHGMVHTSIWDTRYSSLEISAMKLWQSFWNSALNFLYKIIILENLRMSSLGEPVNWTASSGSFIRWKNSINLNLTHSWQNYLIFSKGTNDFFNPIFFRFYKLI